MHLSIVCVVCIYLLGMVVVLWGTRNLKKEPAAPTIVLRHAPTITFEEHVADRANQLTEEHMLTSREHDMLIGLAQGNTAARIANNLCLSTSTVQGYIKSLYVKLGVNSKQEVIDLFSVNDTDKT